MLGWQIFIKSENKTVATWNGNLWLTWLDHLIASGQATKTDSAYGYPDRYITTAGALAEALPPDRWLSDADEPRRTVAALPPATPLTLEAWDQS